MVFGEDMICGGDDLGGLKRCPPISKSQPSPLHQSVITGQGQLSFFFYEQLSVQSFAIVNNKLLRNLPTAPQCDYGILESKQTYFSPGMILATTSTQTTSIQTPKGRRKMS